MDIFRSSFNLIMLIVFVCFKDAITDDIEDQCYRELNLAGYKFYSGSENIDVAKSKNYDSTTYRNDEIVPEFKEVIQIEFRKHLLDYEKIPRLLLDAKSWCNVKFCDGTFKNEDLPNHQTMLDTYYDDKENSKVFFEYYNSVFKTTMVKINSKTALCKTKVCVAQLYDIGFTNFQSGDSSYNTYLKTSERNDEDILLYDFQTEYKNYVSKSYVKNNFIIGTMAYCAIARCEDELYDAGFVNGSDLMNYNLLRTGKQIDFKHYENMHLINEQESSNKNEIYFYGYVLGYRADIIDKYKEGITKRKDGSSTTYCKIRVCKDEILSIGFTSNKTIDNLKLYEDQSYNTQNIEHKVFGNDFFLYLQEQYKQLQNKDNHAANCFSSVLSCFTRSKKKIVIPDTIMGLYETTDKWCNMRLSKNKNH